MTTSCFDLDGVDAAIFRDDEREDYRAVQSHTAGGGRIGQLPGYQVPEIGKVLPEIPLADVFDGGDCCLDG